MERTENSRLMRGVREVFYEYILEFHGRMDEAKAWVLVGHGGGMHVIAGGYHRKIGGCTCQGRQCELSVKLGGNTGF